jgi:hypothetical protein
MSEPTLKLQRNAEELLQEFPVTEPDFEAQAQAIQARLKGTPGGMVFDDWLKVPELDAEPGEPGLPSSVRATSTPKSAPKSNFAEMARKSVQQKDDSKELAKELLAATAQSRRPNAEMVERVRAAGRAAATSTPVAGSAGSTPSATTTPLPSTDASVEDAPRNSGVVARSATTVRPAAAPANNRGVIIGIIGGAVALAACVALFVRSSGEDQRTRAALAAQKAADAPIAAPKVNVPSPAATLGDEGVVTPEALAAAQKASPGPALGQETKPSAARAGAAVVAAAPVSKAAPTPSAEAKPEAVVLEDDPAPAAPPAAATKPEPTTEPPLKPAEGNATSVPLQPSGGAVSTALNSVRGGAQACLAGQTDPVSAVVTFASDGHVLRVSASGPSAACIQAALSKAHIAPFAKESFSATTTIRPP